MPDFASLFQEWVSRIPFPESATTSVDFVGWVLISLVAVAIAVAISFSLTTRRSFLKPDALESSPNLLLARIKQDPTRMPPVAIVSRLGADATLELLEYGDQVSTNEWRYRWSSVREDILRILSEQNAFGPTHALARYYRSADRQEPETLRIRRTALIHKLGLQRYLEPDLDGNLSTLRIRAHPAEVEGDLGFEGETFWLLPDEPATSTYGPVVEMDPIEFRTLQDAELHLSIRRSPTVGGGFRLTMNKRHGFWVVVDEEVEWVS